ncbi:MAG: zf-HC2 domain-containing protein [Acidobacteria bacterium]|nr:zf-HC2 domain-containing protein [Acidobacteriota bacterium]
MDCDFTEEVSLLVDGELAPREAARLSAHVETCASCRQAREAFLLLRQELRSYESSPEPHAQTRALAAILGSHISDRRWPERLAAAFDFGRLRPAHVLTLALLLVTVMFGLRWLNGPRPSPVTRPASAPQLANKDDVKEPPVKQAKEQEPAKPTGTKPTVQVSREAAQVRRRNVPRKSVEEREDSGRDSLTETARAGGSTLPSIGTSVADPAVRIGRHAERVERLLRSFRNARLTEDDPTLDMSDARRLSKRLLYSNIALRREAAGAGDLPAEGWLDSLEPILVDISNLPNNPSADAVGSIKERIRRRQLVGVLQSQVMLASRP